MEISKMLTVSTGHVSKKTAKLLDNDVLNIPLYHKGEYGWFIFLDKDDLDNEYASDDGYDFYYVPEELLKLMKFAKDLGCDWLCLDSDGEVLEYFETYDW